MRIGNIVDVVNRRGDIHLPAQARFRIIGLHLFGADVVNSNTPFHQVQSKDIYKIKLRDITGIPLTKERAMQYGFYPERNIAEKWYSSGHERRCLRIMFNDKGYWLILWDKEEGVNLGRVYQYEHELQNVWHSITGEELTTK